MSLQAEGHDCAVFYNGKQAKVSGVTIKLPEDVAAGSTICQGPIIAKMRTLATLNQREAISRRHTGIWQAKDFRACSPACRLCGKELSTKIWKDMPSEHWAELMDFWHCHKPDAQFEGNPGYSGNFVPKERKAFVSQAYILVHPSDVMCNHLASSKSPVKIWKWDLKLGDRICSPAVFVMTIFQELATAHAISTFEMSGSKSSILVWVFNQDIVYSIPRGIFRGAKLLYTTDMSLRCKRPEIECVDLPAEIVDEFILKLSQHTDELPPSAQKFGEWDVAFMEYI